MDHPQQCRCAVRVARGESYAASERTQGGHDSTVPIQDHSKRDGLVLCSHLHQGLSQPLGGDGECRWVGGNDCWLTFVTCRSPGERIDGEQNEPEHPRNLPSSSQSHEPKVSADVASSHKFLVASG